MKLKTDTPKINRKLDMAKKESDKAKVKTRIRLAMLKKWYNKEE